MTTTRELSRLRRLKAQYRQLGLREQVRGEILQTITEHFSAADPTTTDILPPRRRWRGTWWAVAALAAAAGAVLAWVTRPGPEKLDLVVSSVRGQAFSDGERKLLGPRVHVAEGQRLRTSTVGTAETKVGAHVVALGADTSLMLERLRPQDLRFRLDRGTVTMTVAPLRREQRFRVVAGDLSIEVVGTVFTVNREGSCSSVSVRTGRVAIAYQGVAGELRAGEQRQFCPLAKAIQPSGGDAGSTAGKLVPAPQSAPNIESMAKALPRAPRRDESPRPPPAQHRHEERAPLPKGRLSAWTESPQQRAETLPPMTERLSEEESSFRDAARTEGDISSRARRMQAYLASYPNGIFVEDALFQLIRDSYAIADSAQVLRFSEQFLQRFHRGRRASEVRFLYVQSQIEMGLPAGRWLGALEALLAHLESLPLGQREQATYSAVLGYCGSPRAQLCQHWLDRYLASYPQGRYANEVRRRKPGDGEIQPAGTR